MGNPPTRKSYIKQRDARVLDWVLYGAAAVVAAATTVVWLDQ